MSGLLGYKGSPSSARVLLDGHGSHLTWAPRPLRETLLRSIGLAKIGGLAAKYIRLCVALGGLLMMLLLLGSWVVKGGCGPGSRGIMGTWLTWSGSFITSSTDGPILHCAIEGSDGRGSGG